MGYQGGYSKPENADAAPQLGPDPKFAEGLKAYQDQVAILQEKTKEVEIYLGALTAQVDELTVKRNGILGEIKAAESYIETARKQAQDIVDEAVKIASDKTAEIYRELDIREKTINDAAESLKFKVNLLNDANDDLTKRSVELDTRETDLSEHWLAFNTTKTAYLNDVRTLKADREALAAQSNELVSRRMALDAREKSISDTTAVLDGRLHVYQAEKQALEQAQQDLKVQQAALATIADAQAKVDADQEQLKNDVSSFSTARDRLQAREAALVEYEKQLNNQRSDLEQREQILVDRFKGDKNGSPT